MYNVAKSYTPIDTAFAMGQEMGLIFWMIFYPTTQYLDREIQGLPDNSTYWGQDYTWDQIIHRRADGPQKPHAHPRQDTEPKSKGQGEDIFEWIGDFVSKKMLDN